MKNNPKTKQPGGQELFWVSRGYGPGTPAVSLVLRICPGCRGSPSPLGAGLQAALTPPDQALSLLKLDRFSNLLAALRLPPAQGEE